MQERLRNSLAVETVAPTEAIRRAPYGETAQVATRLLLHVRHCSKVERAEMAGGFRRKTDTVGYLDLMVASKELDSVKQHFLAFPAIVHALTSSATDASAIVTGG